MFALQSTSCMTGASDEAGEHTALLEQQHITDTDTADTQNVLRREHAGFRSVLVFSLAFFLAFTAWHPLQVSLNNLSRMQHVLMSKLRSLEPRIDYFSWRRASYNIWHG